MQHANKETGNMNNKTQMTDSQLITRWQTVLQQIQYSVQKRDSNLNDHNEKLNDHNKKLNDHNQKNTKKGNNENKSNENGLNETGSDEVSLIAVSKTKPAHMVEVLAKAGQRDFGENYLQEAIEKIEALAQIEGCSNIHWHYIGHIQRNKTRDISENFDWVHTIERQIIAKRLNDQRPKDLPKLNVLIQVNIDKEENKSGCLPDEVDALVASIKSYERLNLRGLMIIPAVIASQSENDSDSVQDNTQAFERTRRLFDTLKANHPELTQWDTLSMGMSADMEAAIRYGSTMVRVGTAIFGER